MVFSIPLECLPGPDGEPIPHVLHFGQARVKVRELVDHWPGADHHYFKLLGEDGATYIVRHDLQSGLWELTLYESVPGVESHAPFAQGRKPDAGPAH